MIEENEHRLTAFHEAGHAVAVILRSGTIIAIAIRPDGGETHHGATDHYGADWANPFIAYAGPWAEARVQWSRGDIGATTSDGRTFKDFVRLAFEGSADAATYAAYLPHEEAWSQDPPTFEAKTARWDEELEDHWSVIRAVAAELLSGGTVTHRMVQNMIDAHS